MAARASEHDRDATFPHEAFDALRPTGALSLTVPAACGGGGGGLAACCELVEALGRADASVALVVALHSIFHASLAHPENPWPAARAGAGAALDGGGGRPGQRPAGGAGAGDAGPGRAAGDRGHAVGDDRGWRISGHKIYTTGIPRLRWLAVWARTQGNGSGHRRRRRQRGAAGRDVPGRGGHPRLPGRADLGPPGHAGHPQRRRDLRRRRDPRRARGGADPRRHAAHRGARSGVPGLEQPRPVVDLPRRGTGGAGLAGRLPQRADAHQPRRAAGHAAPLPAGGRRDRGAAARQRPPDPRHRGRGRRRARSGRPRHGARRW